MSNVENSDLYDRANQAASTMLSQAGERPGRESHLKAFFASLMEQREELEAQARTANQSALQLVEEIRGLRDDMERERAEHAAALAAVEERHAAEMEAMLTQAAGDIAAAEARARAERADLQVESMEQVRQIRLQALAHVKHAVEERDQVIAENAGLQADVEGLRSVVHVLVGAVDSGIRAIREERAMVETFFSGVLAAGGMSDELARDIEDATTRMRQHILDSEEVVTDAMAGGQVVVPFGRNRVA